MSDREIVIVAPHPDDEIIGCYELLAKDVNPIIIYSGETLPKRREEAVQLRKHAKIKHQMFQQSVPSTFINDNTTIYIPDPIYEIHPEHRRWGQLGESLARNGIDVIFYSINMNAPYIHEIQNIDGKEALLNTVYGSQKSLWQYERKYLLFEGRCKWIF
jgi:hypothetical protein